MNDPDDHESQAVRRRVLRNDRLVREQATTFHQFAAVEAEEIRGRFGSTEKATVIGSTPAPDYPAAYQQRDPVPTEPPLGVDVNALEPTGELHEIRQSLEDFPEPVSASSAQITGGPADAPSGGSSSATLSGLVSEPAGPSPFQTESKINGED